MRQFAKVAVFLFLLVGPWGPPAAAQEAAAPRGVAGPVGKEALLEELRRLTGGSPPLSGYVVRGADLVAILLGDVPVRLADCIVEDSLVFRDVAVVTVPLELRNCEIRPERGVRGQWNEKSVYAISARFGERVDFRGSTFVGQAVFTDSEFTKSAGFDSAEFPDSANFNGATFARDANFLRARIAGASFADATFDGRANFRGAEFERAADFGGARFNHTAVFRTAVFETDQVFHATFNGKVDFKEADFWGVTDFKSVGFPMGAEFTGATFNASTSFANATFAEPSYFDGMTIGGDANFSKAIFTVLHFSMSQFEGEADFSGARIADGGLFLETRFGGDAKFLELDSQGLLEFSGADFGALADFTFARFTKYAAFDGTKFGGKADFFGGEFSDYATYKQAEFMDESEFGGARFSGEAFFPEARFHGPASFAMTIAERFASFRSAVFDNIAGFEAARFGESVDFKAAVFKDRLVLNSAHLGAYADLRDAQIAVLDFDSVENPTILRSRIDMRGAEVADARFQNVIFENTVDLSDAAFGRPMLEEQRTSEESPPLAASVFRFVTFEDDVSFARTSFAGRLALENVKFQGLADFTDADFRGLTGGDGPSFLLSYVDFKDLLLDWSQLPAQRYWVRAETIDGAIAGTGPSSLREPISRTLSELEARFRAGDRLDDANAAYYHRKRAELREVRRHGTAGARVLAEAEWIFWGLVCGYGTQIWWVLGWAVLANLIFTFIYWSAATVDRKPHPERQEEFSFRLRLLDFPKQYAKKQADLPFSDGPLRRFVDSLRVSSVILFKIGYRDTTIDGRLGPIPMSYLVAVEWALGFYLLAALTVTLANTQPLINRLISGVF